MTHMTICQKFEFAFFRSLSNSEPQQKYKFNKIIWFAWHSMNFHSLFVGDTEKCLEFICNGGSFEKIEMGIERQSDSRCETNKKWSLTTKRFDLINILIK